MDWRRNLPTSVKDLSKEELGKALKKKKQCNADALKIVEAMLENPVSEEWFLDSLKRIRQTHFEDIVDERAILKMCGYPLCCGTLKNVSSHQYHISLKEKKVYDITERKKFCSNQCYRAGKYLKDQLLTTPLWFIAYEDIPDFKLLPITSTGMVGEEVDIGHVSRAKLVESSEECVFTSANRFISDSLNEIDINKSEETLSSVPVNEVKENEASGEELSSNVQSEDSLCDTETPGFNVNFQIDSATQRDDKNATSESTLIDIALESAQNTKSSLASSDINSKQRDSDREDDSRQKQNTKDDSINSAVKDDKLMKGGEEIRIKPKRVTFFGKGNNNRPTDAKTSNGLPPDDYVTNRALTFVLRVETCLREWFNLETLIFLLGEDKVKEMIIDKGKSIKEYYKVISSKSWDPKLQERYDSICRRLNVMEIEDTQYDQNVLTSTREMKPLPDYSAIQEEGKKLEMKVSAFYQGKTTYMSSDDENVESRSEDDGLKPDPLLPLVDKHAQKCYRRKIVLDRLNKVVPDLLQTFGLTSPDYGSELRALVRTFSLDAHNIFFTPHEWLLLGLVVINMLALKYSKIKDKLNTPKAKTHQVLMLIPYQQDSGYIGKLVNWLIDIDSLVDTPQETQ